MKRTDSQDGRSELIEFEGLGHQLGIGWPPPHGAMQSTMNAIVQGVIREVGKMDEGTARAKVDPNLSDQGRREKIATFHPTVRDAIARARQSFDVEDKRIATERGKLLATPQLDLVDAVGGTLDAEIRARVRGLTGVPRDRMVADLKAGANDRVLHALARDPFPNFWREFAQGVLHDRVKKEKPAELDALNAAADVHEWAATAVGALANMLTKIGLRT